jgi:hypothetical protein
LTIEARRLCGFDNAEMRLNLDEATTHVIEGFGCSPLTHGAFAGVSLEPLQDHPEPAKLVIERTAYLDKEAKGACRPPPLEKSPGLEMPA